MAKKTIIEDYDLDVFSVLKDFPENDTDSFIYIRGQNLDENTVSTVFDYSGECNNIVTTLMATMQTDKDFKSIMYDVVLNQLRLDELESYFIDRLNELSKTT